MLIDGKLCLMLDEKSPAHGREFLLTMEGPAYYVLEVFEGGGSRDFLIDEHGSKPKDSLWVLSLDGRPIAEVTVHQHSQVSIADVDALLRAIA